MKLFVFTLKGLLVLKSVSIFFHRPDVDFDVRLMRAVQVMDIPMLKDFINALVMDSLTYGNIQLSRSHYLNKLVYRE